MASRPARERAGFTMVYLVSGAVVMLARAEFEPLSMALRAGTEWYEGMDLYGDDILIRLALVEAVEDSSPTGIAASDREAEEREAYERLHGTGDEA